VEEDIELRLRAVEPEVAGWKPTAIGREVGQSRQWVRRWLRRYEEEGDDGLADRPPRPKTSPSRLSQVVVDEIVMVRRLLCPDRFANCGPKAIVAEIERRGLLETVPSVSLIKRVLATNNLSRRYHRRRRSPMSTLGLPQVTSPGVWQQSDWVQDRYLAGGIRFSSLEIADVGSHMMWSASHRRRTLLAAVRQLTEKAWPQMSIPLAMGTDNAFSKTSVATIRGPLGSECC